jgi:hypothetical protein
MTLIPAVLRPGSDPLKMKWDFENKLVAADIDNDNVDDVFYRFDALGRRVRAIARRSCDGPIIALISPLASPGAGTAEN